MESNTNRSFMGIDVLWTAWIGFFRSLGGKIQLDLLILIEVQKAVMMKLQWFVATIILKCEIDGKPSVPGEWTCIQSIFLVRAPNRDDAYQKGMEIGYSQETSYLNADGMGVTWKFVGLENLEILDSKVIRDGTEIRGRVFYTEDPKALVVEKDGLSVFYYDRIKDLTAAEILEEGINTRLICNRVESY